MNERIQPSAAVDRAAELNERHDRYLWDAVIRYYETPLPLARGRGHCLYDFDGNEYLDFFGGILTVSVGHCHPTVTKAIQEQAETLVHTSTLYPTAPVVDLAEKIAALTPGDLTKSFFTNSGTEADETALMLARAATGNQAMIALRHAYSGRSMLAVTVTAHGAWHPHDYVAGVKHALAPYCYRCPLKLTYPECGVACAEDIEELIRTTTPGKVAAFIAEPIMGVGGFITPPREYFQIAAEIVRRHGGLFIADEVQTGWGRTGDEWWGIEQYGVVPDMMTMAKGVANGMPMGVTVTTPEIASEWKGLTISTFGGNPVSCAASRATIQVIEEEGLVENAAVQGTRLRDGLDRLKERHALIGDVRGMGLMQGVELVADRTSKEPAPRETTRLLEAARKRGLLIGKGGLYGNVLRIAPCLNIGADQVDRALEILDDSLEEVGA
ncbi:MAG TPA: aspartate aminotransferase family protein [Gemmatimonadota bacterium]|nr:aspartate aminotransferase family protein [Gemmatimonadota bacterium]